jgi:hypothetical protein
MSPRKTRRQPAKTPAKTSQHAAERRRQAIDATVAELDQLGEKLLAAHSAMRIKAIRDRAELLRLRALGRGQAARRARQQAAELKVQAEWKLGAWLRDNLPRGGDHRSAGRSRSRLRRLGIDPHQSSRWQQIASLSENAFKALAREARRQGRELTTAAALRAADPLAKDAVRPGNPASPVPTPRSESEADRCERLAEIHRHAGQAASLLAPAFAGQPERVLPEQWTNLKRLIREIGEFSAPEGRKRPQ